MRNTGSSGLWPFLALVAVGSTVVSMMGSSEVQGVPRACCFDNADCSFLSRSTCVSQQGAPQAVGTNCETFECPLLCGGSFPACNGACPNPGQTCQEVELYAADGGGAKAASDCECRYGACCLGATGGYPGCTQLFNETSCEDQGGVYLGDGTNCSACQGLCGFSAPACGGECPPGSRCAVAGLMAQTGQAAGGGASDLSPCACEPITGACCPANPATGECRPDVNASYCEEIGGTYQGDDTNCSTVDCPRDCGYANAPECNGACPEGTTCFATGDFAAQGGGAGGSNCQCFTPPGGECIPEQDACQPGFVCDPSSETCCNRICDGEGESCDTTGICRVVAPAPAVSHTGLVVLFALLIAAGGLGMLRLRVRRQ